MLQSTVFCRDRQDIERKLVDEMGYDRAFIQEALRKMYGTRAGVVVVLLEVSSRARLELEAFRVQVQ